jgi:hypothetical protein
MSQSSSSPSVIVVMMSSLPPSSAALLPSALRSMKKSTAAATANERKRNNTVTFSQHRKQQHSISSSSSSSLTSRACETSSDHRTESNKTRTTAIKPQHHHVEEMVLRLQRQAERTIQLDRQHKEQSNDLAEDDFPRIPATCDELDDNDDDDAESLTSDDCSSSSSGSSCGDATDEEEEDRIVKQMVEHAFRRKRKASAPVPSVITASSGCSDTASTSSSSQSTASLVTADHLPSQQNPFKKQRLQPAQGVTTPLPSLPCPRAVASDAFRTYARRSHEPQQQQQGRGLSFSLSEPNLVGRAGHFPSRASKVPTPAQLSPHDFLRQMHEKAGGPVPTMRPAQSIPHFFVKGCQDEYDMTIVQAVRSANLDLIRQLKTEQGRNLQCCNKFGESIVHTVARHGLASVLELLLDLKVSVQVCCDSGRSPLSDACWTQVPQPTQRGVVDVLLDTCPDLLYVTDRRGLSPLSYVPRDHWEAWCRYLEHRGLDRLRPNKALLGEASHVVG